MRDVLRTLGAIYCLAERRHSRCYEPFCCQCRRLPETYLRIDQGDSGLGGRQRTGRVEAASPTAPRARLGPIPAGAVFISYASHDAFAAERIAHALRAAKSRSGSTKVSFAAAAALR